MHQTGNAFEALLQIHEEILEEDLHASRPRSRGHDDDADGGLFSPPGTARRPEGAAAARGEASKGESEAEPTASSSGRELQDGRRDGGSSET